MSVPERYRGRMRALMDGPDGILGCFCLLPSPFAAEMLGRAGFDFVVVDNQHGLAGRTETTAMLLALEATGTPALLRPPVNSPELIGWALDAGAQGVVIPMVSSADDVRAAVAACRYPPGGGRSWGPLRLLPADSTFSIARENRDVVCIAMIETQEGLDNLDEIVTVDGLDAVLIGQGDLALALGLDPVTGQNDAVHHIGAVERIRDAIHAQGRTAIIQCNNVAQAVEWRSRGFRAVSVGSDLAYLLQRAREVVAAAGRPSLIGVP